MKRTRFLAMILVVSLMLMGAGYAAWNESITINSTVETGYLNVAMLNGTVKVYQNSTITTVDGLDRTATAVLDTSVTEENEVDVTVTNLYPGAHVEVVVPITNDGTIPVKLDALNPFTVNDTEAWYNVTAPVGPVEIAVNETQDITFELDVLDDALEDDTATFSITANYIQFNQ